MGSQSALTAVARGAPLRCKSSNGRVLADMSELETLDYDESPSPRTQEFYAQYSGNQQFVPEVGSILATSDHPFRIQSLPENPARSTTPVAEQPSTAHCIDRQSSRTSSSPSRQAAPPTRGGSSNGHDEGNWGEPPARWRSTNTSQDAFHPFPPANRSSTRRTTGRRPPRYIDTYRPVYSPRPKAPEEHCDQALASAPLRHYEQPSGSRIADIQPRATVAQEAFDFVARIIAAADGIFGVRAHDRHHSYAQTWVVVPGDARAYSWFDGSLAASLPGVTLTGDSAHDPALRTLGAALQSLAFAEPQDRPAWQAQVNVDLAEALQRPGQGSIRLYAPAVRVLCRP